MTMQLDAKQRSELRILIKNVSTEWVQAKQFNQSASESIKDFAKKHDLKPKQLRQLAKIYHQQSFNQVAKDNEDIMSMYEDIMLTPNKETAE